MEAFGVLLACAFFAVAVDRAGVLDRANGIVYDAFMASKARSAPDDRILLVAIDNRSLEALGRWPWPRETHARLIDRLREGRAAAAALDLLLVEPAPDDDALAAAMTAYGRVCLPVAVQPVGSDGAPWDELGPAPILAGAAAGLGHVNLSPDPDGVVRRLPIALRAPGRTWPHLVSCALLHADMKHEPVRTAPWTGSGPIQALPLGVAFPSHLGAFQTVSYVDLLNGEVPAAALNGRVVIVGMTADGQGDRYAVSAPRGVLAPGVEIQAALADTLLSGGGVRAAPAWIAAAACLLGLVILLGAFLMLTPKWGLAVAAGLIGAVFAVSAALFAIGVWVPPLAAASALALACPLWSWRRLAVTSAYLDTELRRFAQDAASSDTRALFSPFILDGQDVVGRQTQAMREALSLLRNHNRFIADTLESLPDAAVVIDSSDVVLYANDRARRLFDRPTMDGLNLRSELGPLHPDLADSIETGGEAALDDGRCLRLDAARLEHGSDLRLIVRLADVTDLRSAERQREQALQLLGHDMRAPQTAILSLVESQADHRPNLLKQVADYARMTLNLADDYVRLARAELGPLHIERLGLSDLAVEAADLLWPATQARQVRIDVVESPEIEIDADRGLISRALMNLIDNAVKHSPDGAQVQVSIVREGDHAIATVSDAGSGLSEAEFARLTRPFQHGSDGRAGVGLGLAFVDQAARRHGGVLELGAPAPGAAFILSLPAARGGAAEN